MTGRTSDEGRRAGPLGRHIPDFRRVTYTWKRSEVDDHEEVRQFYLFYVEPLPSAHTTRSPTLP